MSGIYGMNVSQISGTSANPNIWQFFVAVFVMNILMVIILSVSSWVNTQSKHKRKPGLKEMIGFAVGSSGFDAS
jgi:hypothetical protein